MNDLAIPNDVLTKLRAACLGLPDAHEEKAWVGIRWCIRKKNFGHVVMIHEGWPPAYALATGSDGPACGLTFRLSASKLVAPRFARRPFFRLVWFPNIAGLLLDDSVDWDGVESLLTLSYCVLAPKKLDALIDRVDL